MATDVGAALAAAGKTWGEMGEILLDTGLAYGDAEGVPAEVEVVEEIGADAFAFCAAEIGGETTKLVARVEARRAPARGERVVLRPQPAEAHLFDPESGDRLGD
jgi:multiple sugar transport system ATP-binding protein